MPKDPLRRVPPANDPPPKDPFAPVCACKAPRIPILNRDRTSAVTTIFRVCLKCDMYPVPR